jgi:protein-tyrosine phosphatase
MGLNRSAYIAALVLILIGYTPQEAIKLIREKRSEFALNNQYFVSAILKTEQIAKSLSH